jgi:diacylglycerol kinase family enzyme
VWTLLNAQAAGEWQSVKKWLAIVNPASGQYSSSGFEQRWMPELRDLVEDVVLTDGAGEATEITRRSTEYDGIVAVGGDGTILEIVAGMQRDRQHRATIPTGRGNCLARDLGVKTVADGLQVLRNGDGTAIDLMHAIISFGDGSQANYLSASTIAIGYVVSVVERASGFRAAGAYGYALATLLTPPKLFTCHLNIGDDGAADRTCTGIVINNTVNLANFPAFKDARLQDGLADVLVLSVGRLRQTFHNFSVLTGLGIYDAGDHRQATGVSLALVSPHTLMIDGQLLPNVISLTVECVPEALWCRKARTA